ncbi:MAG: HAD-IIIC family phosphatase [Coriobacteriia bacterium]
MTLTGGPSAIAYKCICLDLDNTLWPGVLVDDGIQGILSNLNNASTCAPFTSFQKVLVEIAAKGIFIALCTRNTEEAVRSIIDDYLTPDLFPLKDYIDLIVANDNPKSENIRRITREFNILPSSIIFVDDSLLNREEVRLNMKDVCVFDFPSDVAQLTSRFEEMGFRFNYQQGFDRRERYRLVSVAKAKHQLPGLGATIREMDDQCSDEIRDRVLIALLERTNQFNWTKQSPITGARYFFVDLFHAGRELGIVSAFAATTHDDTLVINNWAVSCGFFDIGLEDYVFQEMIALALQDGCSAIAINYNSSADNERCRDFADKYGLEFNTEHNSVVLPIIGSASALLQAIAGNHNIVETASGDAGCANVKASQSSAVTRPLSSEIE